jgi:hypothetical protein
MDPHFQVYQPTNLNSILEMTQSTENYSSARRDYTAFRSNLFCARFRPLEIHYESERASKSRANSKYFV